MPSGNMHNPLDLLDQISFCHKDHITPGLYIVATPIGNLADISLRALNILKNVEEILCEDTRETAKLATAYGFTTQRTAYHDHNAQKVRPKILERLLNGATIALVSDAGTPLVSDPGHKLVQGCYAQNIPVTSIPGASACITAYTLSGIPSEAFFFGGFLSPKTGARQKILSRLANTPATLIFYETHARLESMIKDAHTIFGNRRLAIARELTKKFEEVYRTTLKDFDKETLTSKGELVVLIGPPEEEKVALSQFDALLSLMLPHIPIKQCASALASLTNTRKKDLYDYAITYKERPQKKG